MIDRRRFIGGAAAGGLLAALPPVARGETRIAPLLASPDSGIDALVKRIEETDRGKLLEEVGARIRGGTSYREVVAALLLAGVRNVQPRPSVGFKFHAVLAANAAHLASVAGPDAERWLPVFWALDNFKSSQLDERRHSGWTQGPVDEKRVPRPGRAAAAFVDAMEKWDDEAADAAAAGIVRGLPAHQVFDLLARFGGRDFRSIGHKAIFVSGGWRLLQVVGWRHAERVVRSMARALLTHSGENPSKIDDPADRPWRENLPRARALKPDWRGGKADDGAVPALIATLREATDAAAAAEAARLLGAGISPDSIWDGLQLASAELLMRGPGIPSLHALTTTNAMRYAFETTASDETRRLILLQAASFVTRFRDFTKGRDGLNDLRIDGLEPAGGEKPPTVGEIFKDVGPRRKDAARKVLAYRAANGSAREFINTARRLVFFKGRNAHDYKFNSAVLEDYGRISPRWRDRFLAATTFWLRGSDMEDSGLVARTRAALKA